MAKLENCGYCGHKPYISIYFSLRDQEIISCRMSILSPYRNH